MSTWTYMHGFFQGQVSREDTEKTFEEVLGKMITWDDSMNGVISDQEWKDAFDKNKNPIPMGSEGSLEYCIGFRKSENYGKTVYITFEGHLRDFGGEEDARYVRKWFVSVFNRIYSPSAYLSFNAGYSRTYSYEVCGYDYDSTISAGCKNNNKKYFFLEHSYDVLNGSVISRRIKFTDKGNVRNAPKKKKAEKQGQMLFRGK